MGLLPCSSGSEAIDRPVILIGISGEGDSVDCTVVGIVNVGIVSGNGCGCANGLDCTSIDKNVRTKSLTIICTLTRCG